MKLKTILKAVGVAIASLFLMTIIGIAVLSEQHTFRASITGQVTDNRGLPVPNAKIEFIMPNTDSIEYDCLTATNTDGRYSIALPRFKVALDSSPSYRRYVIITASGYVPIGKSLSLKKGNNPKTDFELLKAMPIRGRAVDTKGEPITNKALSFYPGGKKDTKGIRIRGTGTESDDKGYFSLDSAGPYDYSVTLYADENQKAYKQKLCNCEFVSLKNLDGTKELEITFNDPYDYSVEGIIIDSNDNPIPNTYISTLDRYGHRWSAYSDSEGKFCIIGLDGLEKEEFELHVRSTKKIVKLHSKNIKFVIPSM